MNTTGMPVGVYRFSTGSVSRMYNYNSEFISLSNSKIIVNNYKYSPIFIQPSTNRIGTVHSRRHNTSTILLQRAKNQSLSNRFDRTNTSENAIK